MRTEDGQQVPSTLGEYLDLVKAQGIENNQASAFLERKILKSPGGRDQPVLAPHSQMGLLLVGMMMRREPEEVVQ
jgi:hypothetical protein